MAVHPAFYNTSGGAFVVMFPYWNQIQQLWDYKPYNRMRRLDLQVLQGHIQTMNFLQWTNNKMPRKQITVEKRRFKS